MSLPRTEIAKRYQDFTAAVEHAPEHVHEFAKDVHAMIGESVETLMKDLRRLGVKADNCDRCMTLEIDIYSYIIDSNRDQQSAFHSAEAFGAIMRGDDEALKARVMASTIADRDFIQGIKPVGNPYQDILDIVDGH